MKTLIFVLYLIVADESGFDFQEIERFETMEECQQAKKDLGIRNLGCMKDEEAEEDANRR